MGSRIKQLRPSPLIFDRSKFLNPECATRYDQFLKIKWITYKGFTSPHEFFNIEIQRKDWHNFNKHHKKGCAVIVKEFYANLIEQKGIEFLLEESKRILMGIRLMGSCSY